jgi:hypothetical protein
MTYGKKWQYSENHRQKNNLFPPFSATLTTLDPINAAKRSSTNRRGSSTDPRNSFSGMPFRPAAWIKAKRRSESGIVRW